MERLAGRAIIAVMAKAPFPGTVKTRLATLLGDQAGADLSAQFLTDTLALARAVSGAKVHVVCPDGSHRRALRELLPEDVTVVAQGSPTLPATMLADAFAALDAVDLCVGPCPDCSWERQSGVACRGLEWRSLSRVPRASRLAE